MMGGFCGKLGGGIRKSEFLVVGAGFLLVSVSGHAQVQPEKSSATAYKPTIEDWVGVNAAVDNYTLGLERHDMDRFDKAFWPEATIVAQPEPGMSITMPYRQAEAGPPTPPTAGGSATPPPPGGVPSTAPPAGTAPMMPPPGMPAPGGAMGLNGIGTNIPPWHLALSHHFEFQSSTRATHYGYFVSVYPDLATKKTVVGLPGHYDDVLEKRNGEWRILKRTTAVGAK